jgi:putative SOS response-associated peptidase YedK
MCNLYSMTKNQDAIRRLFNFNADSTGNLPSMPGIFPDYPAPIVRNAEGGRELALARCGMPSSQKAPLEAVRSALLSCQRRANNSTSRTCSRWSRTAALPTSGT